jgi:hypothetical protein
LRDLLRANFKEGKSWRIKIKADVAARLVAVNQVAVRVVAIVAEALVAVARRAAVAAADRAAVAAAPVPAAAIARSRGGDVGESKKDSPSLSEVSAWARAQLFDQRRVIGSSQELSHKSFLAIDSKQSRREKWLHSGGLVG